MNEKESTNPDVESEDDPTLGDEQTVVAEESPEEEGESLDVEALREEVKDLRIRAKEVGLGPLRRMGRAYLNNAVDAVEGVLSALEGKSRKKGK